MHYGKCGSVVWLRIPTGKLRANGRNILGCYMLRPFAHPVACCWMLLRVVALLRKV